MNKQQAAEYLGVSVRALERYVQQGRISVKYEKGKTRSTGAHPELGGAKKLVQKYYARMTELRTMVLQFLLGNDCSFT